MTMTTNNSTKSAQQGAGKYLTFVLGNESYGVEVLKVREIIRFVEITSVPQMPDYIKGVVNLRGKIIPVMDLRIRFGLASSEVSDNTCIVVVQTSLPTGVKTSMGLVVDAVEEVTNIAADEIEDTPSFGGSVQTECILGMAKIKGMVKTLLDIDRVIAAGVGTGSFQV